MQLTLGLLFTLLTMHQSDCCLPKVAVCRPAIEKVTYTRTCYHCRTKTICLPYCPKCFLGKKASCECGKPRSIRVLLKRFVKEDVCEVQCKPCPALEGPRLLPLKGK